MAPNYSKLFNSLPNDTKVFISLSVASLSYWSFSTIFPQNKKSKFLKEEVKFCLEDPDKKATSKKVQVDAEFLRSLKNILKVIIPGFYTPETFYLFMVAFFLVSRSLCDIYMINNGTLIESAIITGNLKGFRRYLGNFFLAMPTISLVNNLMKFGLNKLKLNFRTRLSNHLYNSYLNGFTYYKMSNLDNRISNPDQLLTQDVEKFCDSVVDLYSNVSKPILDIMIYIQKLTVAIGGQAPAIMICYMLFSGFLLTNLRKPISRMTAGEQRLEGEFRFVNSRLITNSEEIAFYNGNRRERLNVESSFSRLVNHLEKLINFRCNMGFVDNIIAKYFATCVGFSVVAYPYLVSTSPLASKSYQERMREYYKTGRMLVKLAEAIGRLILAGRELTKLAGFTSRVQELIVVLNDLNRGHYQRTMVDPKLSNGLTRMSSLGSGTVVYEDKIIKFESVPLITPNGDVLVKELNFEVKSGMNVLVCGPNGCGKSSLFRILGGLWPVFGGVLTKPSSGKLFYIPQRPYMTLGSFRDQVIYPDTKREMESKGITDKDLEKLLERVQLLHLLQREEDGWNTISDWMDVLSGGEKQRVAMARVFYHRPQFAILDECTSAVSVDVEGEMYRYCREAGITLFTVSHRKSLWKHHEFYLHMDGRGSFEFKKIEDDTQEYGS
ncbi:UNVERIFIED_CONTAM: hypothetical protein RMT77_001555 [Armadillidium vulgare]